MGHISTLPTELLVSVFLDVRDECPTTWLRVLSVCRTWYEIACSAAPLWSKLTFDGRCDINLFRTYLHRSENAKLKLSLDIHAVEGDSLLDIVHQHSTQLRVLSVVFSPAQTGLLQQRLDDPGFSQLITDLELHCLTAEAPRMFLRPLALRSLRSLLATQVLPRSGAGSTFDTVTRLKLVQIWHVVPAEDQSPDGYDILPVIGKFPALGSLVLRDALPPFLGNTTVDQVSLPLLRTLEVNETIEDIKFLLQHLVLPASAHISVVARVADAMWEAANDGTFLSILPENREVTLPMIHHSTALRLFAGHTEHGALALAGDYDATTLLDDPAWCIVLPDCGDVLHESTCAALEELSQIVPPSGLTHLELHVAPRVLLFDVDWMAVLGPLHRVRNMVVGSRWAAEGLVMALYRHPVLLPDLQVLELCLEELLPDTLEGPLPPPDPEIPPRAIKKVVIVQGDDAKVPYLAGTTLGSMISASEYDFKHSSCSACHVIPSNQPELDGDDSSNESDGSMKRTMR
ncbi:hypothetical protein BN946_scf184992.g36 [Trametes cinnabarina]|uniref:F-box domain-containing protein n=1 Tax=Pycnoporus cinnabarinus TaxID=5643 RepID=A0A060S3T3_PYCCI|nr:hypothetical protein BN946_scf184992.g36 [Trametes cinnabarina]